MSSTLRERLKDAVEGECEGLALSDEQADAILDYVMLSEDFWFPLETAPRDGTIIWLGNQNNIRLGFWKPGAQYEYRGSVGGGWRDWYAGENGDAADLHFTPTRWRRTPKPPVDPTKGGRDG